MSKKKILLLVILLAVIIPIVVYMAMSTYLSIKSANIIDSSWNNDGILPEDMEEIISENDYNRILWERNTDTDANGKAYHVGDEYAGETIGEIYQQHTFPITVYKFNTAVTCYQYTGEFYSENGKLLKASCRIPCKLYWKLKNGKWVVTDYWFGV